jgi:hypothetical protein
MHHVVNSEHLDTTCTEGAFPRITVLMLYQEFSEVWLRTAANTLYLTKILFSSRPREYVISSCQNIFREYSF